ncbi:MAG TPA: NAD(P)-dependent oxidoreductase [Candidatus Hydrogenedentes bacterium]|nr:NAD(P)-dependent oxidoreductase [Candidatus Hydrogenedentota bacterium]
MSQPPPDTTALEEALSRPPSYAVEAMARVDGDILVLGAGGKMGPSLSVMAKRACDMAGAKRRVWAVSRFTTPEAREYLAQQNVTPIPCDLMAPGALDALPEAANIIYMVGMKFGATRQLARTWAVNAWLPGAVCRRYPKSRAVVFSTGNVYGLTPVSRGGSKEDDPPAPDGEYAMSALGRERVFEYFSQTQDMAQSVIRLNYACDLRYGVLVDIALKVMENRPVPLEMGYLNTIWQGAANAMALASLAHADTPPLILNVTGSRTLRVREVAEWFGERFGAPPRFEGEESADALLSDSSRALALFGRPQPTEEQLMAWVAEWRLRGGALLNKPTHFESRDGRF